MTQYIITETMLQTWRKGCVNLSNPHTNDDICKKCEYRGTGVRKGCCDFDDSDVEKIFRSHPYQSERDKVPNIFICPCTPNENGFCTIPLNCIAKRMYDEEDGDMVCKAMQKLRQQAGEQ
jgi:hypothetical protein